MIKVGQIYKNEFGKCVIAQDGQVQGDLDEEEIIEESSLFAEYPTWQEAVNSREFKE